MPLIIEYLVIYFSKILNHANQFEQFADTEKNMNKLLESFTPVPRIFNCVLKNYVGNQFLF